MSGGPYREPSTAATAAAVPILWRPWMGRLGVVLLVLAPIGAILAGFAVACEKYPRVEDVPGGVACALIVEGVHGMIVVLGSVALVIEGAYTPRTALRLAWAPILFPLLGLARCVRWVARGSEAP